jgi:hypothetical protein
MYHWKITRDHIGEPGAKAGTNANAVGICGGNCNAKGEVIKFRMFDDDGELYYTGDLVGGTGFEPLDDFGRPNAGCTSISLFQKGQWVRL